MSSIRERKGLEARVPPPLVMLVVGLLMWAASHVIPGSRLMPEVGVWLGACVLVAGLAIVAAGAVRFRRVGTTIDPTQPERASSLVVSGVYRITRNPMYLGFALMLVAWALVLGAAIAWPGPLLFAVYIQRFQILPEERALRAAFGDAFDEYARRVRRWI